jgi:hypothetical protein
MKSKVIDDGCWNFNRCLCRAWENFLEITMKNKKKIKEEKQNQNEL